MATDDGKFINLNISGDYYLLIEATDYGTMTLRAEDYRRTWEKHQHPRYLETVNEYYRYKITGNVDVLSYRSYENVSLARGDRFLLNLSDVAEDSRLVQQPSAPNNVPTPPSVTPPASQHPSGGGGGGGGGRARGGGILRTPLGATPITATNDSNVSVTEDAPATITTPEIFGEHLRRINLQIGSYEIIDTARGTRITMDVAPVIVDGRALLPVRFMAYALGAAVEWNANTREVTLTLDGQVLTFGIGEISPELAALGMDVPPQIINGRTKVPLRFISEFFGATVNWDEATRSIEVLTQGDVLA
jgi:hypothetical protein